MVDEAAITRLRGFNRRYFHWLFKIQRDSVEEMQHVDLLKVGHGETMMMEPRPL
jgi:hypothetical protein